MSNDIIEQYSEESVKKGLEFIQTLGEARMFKTKHQLQGHGARKLTDHLFVGLMSLYAMSNDYKYAPTAKLYARRTGMYGGFGRASPSGTDVYQTLFALVKPEGLVDSTPADKLLLAKIKINQPKMRQFLRIFFVLETSSIYIGNYLFLKGKKSHCRFFEILSMKDFI